MISRAALCEPRKYRRIFEHHEDERLRQLVERFGAGDWLWISSHMPNRTPRQCRERYKTYLCPEVNIEPWSEEDDRLLLEKYQECGSKWADFRQFFSHRTVNNIKNRWHTLARRARMEGEVGSSEPEEGVPVNPVSMFAIANLLNKPVDC
jgi:hypothetical protein